MGQTFLSSSKLACSARKPPKLPYPEGVTDHSPGLLRSGYPGYRNHPYCLSTLKGLYKAVSPSLCNPFRVEELSVRLTQGSRSAATLGYCM